MIFITEVWSGLCKLTTYNLLNALMSFGPTQRGPTLVVLLIQYFGTLNIVGGTYMYRACCTRRVYVVGKIIIVGTIYLRFIKKNA